MPLQTRLPGELAQELDSIASEFETDLHYYKQQEYSSDSEQEDIEPLRPLRNFPAIGLIAAMHSAIEVRSPLFRPLIVDWMHLNFNMLSCELQAIIEPAWTRERHAIAVALIAPRDSSQVIAISSCRAG